jgi:hypothetical protein
MGLGELRDDATPERRELPGAVEQDDRRPLPALQDDGRDAGQVVSAFDDR